MARKHDVHAVLVNDPLEEGLVRLGLVEGCDASLVEQCCSMVRRVTRLGLWMRDCRPYAALGQRVYRFRRRTIRCENPVDTSADVRR